MVLPTLGEGVLIFHRCEAPLFAVDILSLVTTIYFALRPPGSIRHAAPASI